MVVMGDGDDGDGGDCDDDGDDDDGGGGGDNRTYLLVLQSLVMTRSIPFTIEILTPHHAFINYIISDQRSETTTTARGRGIFSTTQTRTDSTTPLAVLLHLGRRGHDISFTKITII